MVKRARGAKAKADKLFSEIVRSVGYCENHKAAEHSPQLQCAHIISRRYSNTRTDLRNAFSLCAKCHRYYTDHPREFSRFITDTWAQEHYDDIYPLSQEIGKVDWEDRAEFLKEVKEQLESGEITLEEARLFDKNRANWD